MAEEEIIPEVEQQQPPQLQPQKEEKKKRERPPKQPQKKQQQQQQEIKADDKEKKGKTKLPEDVKELFGKFKEKYGFNWDNESAGFADTIIDDDIIFVRRIPDRKEGYAKYKENGRYLIVKTNKENFKKIKDKITGVKNEEKAEGKADDDEKKEDDIKFEYFNFSEEYFKKNEQLFADSLKQKKFLFNNLGEEKKEEEKKVKHFGWNEFKNLDIIPGISNKDEEKYKEKLKKFDVEKIQENNFGKKIVDEKDLFGIGDEKPIEEKKEDAAKQRLGFDEDVEIEDDIYNSDSDRMTDTDTEDAAKQRQGFVEDDDDIPEFNVQEELQRQQQQKQQRKQQRQRKQLIQSQNNQLINAGHTPNGDELRALIKYNNNSDSLLKLIVSLSNDNKGEVDFKEIGEIQDLNGDITNLYSKMQDLKTKINSSNNAEEKERLLIKYNEKRLKLEDLIKKYSKEAYRLSMLNKKKKATFSNPKYIKNKLNRL